MARDARRMEPVEDRSRGHVDERHVASRERAERLQGTDELALDVGGRSETLGQRRGEPER
jgi:hypothetical protein